MLLSQNALSLQSRLSANRPGTFHIDETEAFLLYQPQAASEWWDVHCLFSNSDECGG